MVFIELAGSGVARHNAIPITRIHARQRRPERHFRCASSSADPVYYHIPPRKLPKCATPRAHEYYPWWRSD